MRINECGKVAEMSHNGHSLALLIKITLLSYLIITNISLGQIPYCWGCTANDVSISDLWLGDAAGNELPDCTIGDTIPVYVWVMFENNQNSQRNGILLYAKITRDGEEIFNSFKTGGECILDYPSDYDSDPKCDVGPESCLAGSGSTGDSFMKSLVQFDYECGQEVKLEDFYIGWESGGTKCDDCVCPSQPYACQHSKCYHGQNMIIPGPNPAISVLKDADPEYVQSGGKVTYTYTVSNTGDADLYDVDLTDDKGLTPIRNSPDIVGDEDNVLEIGEIWSYTAEAYPTADVTNIATVTARSAINEQVTDSDDATVRIISIDVTKSAMPIEGCPETPVQFTIRLLDTGFPISAATITDILPTGLSYVSSSPSGTVDPLNDHKIVWTATDPTLPWEIILNAYMDGSAYGPITNQATATATIYETSLTKDASAAVNVLEDPQAIITQISP